MKTLLDGSVTYSDKFDTFTDVKLNGISVMSLIPTDVKIGKDGYGWVVTRKRYGDAEKVLKMWHDHIYDNKAEADLYYYTDDPNLPFNFVYRGKIAVTLI